MKTSQASPAPSLKPMTLSEAKDQVAREREFKDWNSCSLLTSNAELLKLADEAANLFNQSLLSEVERLNKLNSEKKLAILNHLVTIGELESEVTHWQGGYNACQDVIKELSAENERLKENVKETYNRSIEIADERNTLRGEVQGQKEEIDRLKQALGCIQRLCNGDNPAYEEIWKITYAALSTEQPK